jgi:hypothetical protein
MSDASSEQIANWNGGLSCAKLLPAGDAIYWLVPGTLHRYDGHNDAIIANGYTCNGDMAVSADRIVWAAASSLYSVSTLGGPTSELWHGADNLYSMAGDPLNRGFFAATNTALLLVGANGGAREIVGGQERIGPVIADERYVYWSAERRGDRRCVGGRGRRNGADRE